MINKDNIIKFKENLPPGVKLVAVSKFKDNQQILEAFNLGLSDFGENRPQELKQKMDTLPQEINWHFIGHLQTNKIKMIIDRVSLIHSVDSERLLAAIDLEAKKRERVVNCLLQIYIAGEETKQGLSQSELYSILDKKEHFSNVNITGLMGMASFTDNTEIVAGEFRGLNLLFKDVKNRYFHQQDSFCELSMGMSGDYQIALEHGSTIVRIGSLIFGER